MRLGLVVALSLVSAHGLDRRVGQALHPPALAVVPGPAGDGVRTDPGEAAALRRVVAAVQARSRPGEPIFVANPRHDLVRVGNPLVYVLAGRPNPTRYDVMQPGVVTTAEVQREIVAGLGDVDVVVRWVAPTASEPEPNGAGRSSGVGVLDVHLRSTYRPLAAYGDYEVWVRKGIVR